MGWQDLRLTRKVLTREPYRETMPNLYHPMNNPILKISYISLMLFPLMVNVNTVAPTSRKNTLHCGICF